MGKKRKASGRPFGHAGREETEDAAVKLKITSYEDVADSEDEFHINRDKVLLDEGPEQKRRRKLRGEGEVIHHGCVTVQTDLMSRRVPRTIR